jgi:putative endonuclease
LSAGDQGIGEDDQHPFVPAKAGTQESEAVSFWVYILASRRNGTLYIGMTDDLVRRAWEHRIGAVPGFTKKYGIKMLVWFETTRDARSGIATRATAEKVEQGKEDRDDRAI